MKANQTAKLKVASRTHVQAHESHVEINWHTSISDMENGTTRALREILEKIGV